MRESTLVGRDGLFRYKRRLCHRYSQARKVSGGRLRFLVKQALRRIEQLQRQMQREQEGHDA